MSYKFQKIASIVLTLILAFGLTSCKQEGGYIDHVGLLIRVSQVRILPSLTRGVAQR